MSSGTERAKNDDPAIVGCVMLIVLVVSMLVWWLLSIPALTDCERRGGVPVLAVKPFHYVCAAVLP